MEYALSYPGEVPAPHERRCWLESLERTWEFFLYSSLYLGAAAVGMAYISCLIQGSGLSLPVATTLGLVVFSVYNLNRKTDEAEDALNHASRHRITSSFSRPLLIMAVAAYAAALCIAAGSGIAALGVAILPLIAGGVYSLPFLPGASGYRRLKEIPVCKNLVVSFAWGFTFSLLPVTMLGIEAGSASLLVFIFIFCWTFIASVIPDVRDRAGDATTGVLTIPVLCGVEGTRTLLSAFNLLSGIILVILAAGLLSAGFLVVITFSLLYSQACILAIGRTDYDGFICDVVSDGQFLVIALAGFIIMRGM